jgi:hypothetical protein
MVVCREYRYIEGLVIHRYETTGEPVPIRSERSNERTDGTYDYWTETTTWRVQVSIFAEWWEVILRIWFLVPVGNPSAQGTEIGRDSPPVRIHCPRPNPPGWRGTFAWTYVTVEHKHQITKIW